MSLFGSLMGDFDEDMGMGMGMGFMGNHMNAINAHMRSMNRLMNTFNPDPFNMLTGFDNGLQSNALMERGNGMGGLFGFPPMPNMNRLLNADIGAANGASFCSSSVITMSSGPDGRPQIYQASQSTKTGPGGIRETRKTVQDSVSGVKKMAIGHHIGDRAHIIEKEQDLRTGQLEENQEFINLDEEEAEDFDREFVNRAHRAMGGPRGGAAAICAAPSGQNEVVTIEEIDDDEEEDYQKSRHRRPQAIAAPPQHHNHHTSVHHHHHPYNGGARRHHRSSKHHGQKQKETELDGIVTVKPVKVDKPDKSPKHSKNKTTHQSNVDDNEDSHQ